MSGSQNRSDCIECLLECWELSVISAGGERRVKKGVKYIMSYPSVLDDAWILVCGHLQGIFFAAVADTVTVFAQFGNAAALDTDVCIQERGCSSCFDMCQASCPVTTGHPV